MTVLGLFLAWLVQAALPITGPITITEPFPVVMPAAAPDAPELAPACHNQANVIQFVWRVAPGEEVDRGAVEATLAKIAGQVNYFFYVDSNSRTEYRLPAWKMTADCRLDVAYIKADDTLKTIAGHKQIVIEDSSRYCGLALLYPDNDKENNMNNGPTFAWVARRCLFPRIVAHEILHGLGAVLDTAPHFVDGFHTSDHRDLMATTDDVPTCEAYETIDCGKDDYWSLAPEPGSYLDQHWNSADSVFLISRPRHYAFMPFMALEGSFEP